MAESLRELNRKHYFSNDWLREMYRGQHILKYKTDLDFYDEQIKLRKPDVVVETGTLHGGSALWFADRVNKVITIDVEPQVELRDERVTYITGSSTDPELVKKLDLKGKSVMVVLDADHTKAHVAKEIQLYAPLVTKGQLFVIEDTMFKVYLDNMNPGNGEDYTNGSCSDAVEEWDKKGFVPIDHPDITMNPGGWYVRK